MPQEVARCSFPRREMPRHTSSLQATCHADGFSFVGTIVNLSITGAMLMGCQPIAPDTTIKLVIQDIGQLNASVIWNNGEALGLSFEIGNAQSAMIEQAMSKLVNSLPEQLDRREILMN